MTEVARETMAKMGRQLETRWKPIPSCPNYYADAEGNILGPRGRVLSPGLDRMGYLQVTVYRHGEQLTRKVHQLVCEAFHGAKPSPNLIVCHSDGSKLNNRPTNLRWDTYKANSADRLLHGTAMMGETHPRALLSQAEVDEIRRVYLDLKPGVYVKRGTRAALAKRYGVAVHVIKDIVSDRCWPKKEAA